MKQQILVYSDAYGRVLEESKPNHSYKTVNEYLVQGWRVEQIVSSGISTTLSVRYGHYCYLLTKTI